MWGIARAVSDIEVWDLGLLRISASHMLAVNCDNSSKHVLRTAYVNSL